MKLVLYLTALLFFTGCKSCCDKETTCEPLKTTNEYRLVSTSDGEIRSIIIRSFEVGNENRIYYEGLIEKIDPSKIKGIIYTLALNHRMLQQLSSNETDSADYPLKVSQVLKYNMGDSAFRALINKYSINTKKYSLSVKMIDSDIDDIRNLIPAELHSQFDQDIKRAVVETKTAMYDSINKKKGIKNSPKISVLLKYTYDAECDNELAFWVQDICHPLQTFESDSSVKLIYSSKCSSSINTIKEITKELKYIDTIETHYNKFDGGNVLTAQNYVLVGEDILHKNGGNSVKLQKELSELFNVDHIIFTGLGEVNSQPHELCSRNHTSQPIFHLDLFLTPAGRRNCKNLIFYGQVHTKYYHKDYLTDERKKKINALNDLINETVNSIKQYKPDKNSKLSKLDEFEFIEVPLIVQFGTGRTQGSVDINCVKGYRGFNNAIVEVTDQTKKIYLPYYTNNTYADFTSVKNDVEKIYKYYFDSVIFVNPPMDISNRGALHCYTKVIWRDSL